MIKALKPACTTAVFSSNPVNLRASSSNSSSIMSVSQRRNELTLLAALPTAPMADHDEVMEFVETRGLYSRGLGWIDLHLLLSARIVQLPFWTLDKRLALAALAVGLQPS